MARFPDLRAVDGQPHDPYALNDPTYDVERFVTAAGQDSTVVRVRLPNNYLSRLREIVASRSIPEYKTLEDIIRDGLHHRLHWVNNDHHFKGLRGDLIQMEILSQNELVNTSIALKGEALNSTRETFERAAAKQDKATCQDVLERAQMLYESEGDATTPHGRELKSMIGRFQDEIAGMD